MLKGKWKLFICIALVACVLFSASSELFAAVDKEYGSGGIVVDDELDFKVKSSSLLEAIGALIYGLGSLIELLTSKVFKLVTGSATFPWADAILFNAVPFLDVNIFAADDRSLIAKVYTFLTGTYYSILTLASTFFGIAVMFSAVKLVITAIAEDKAKYKKAIADWLLGLVMLWGMHFFMSFVLYLNEQLVMVASTLATTSITTNGHKLAEATNTNDADEVKRRLKGFIDTHTYGAYDWDKHKMSWWNSNYGMEADYYEAIDRIYTFFPNIAYSLLSSDAVIKIEFYDTYSSGGPLYALDSNGIVSYKQDHSYVITLSYLVNLVTEIWDTDSDSFFQDWDERAKKNKNNKYTTTDVENFKSAVTKIHDDYKDSKGGRRPTGSTSSSQEQTFVVDLARYFKNESWTKANEKSWKNTEISISNAIMYVIFVCYSVVFFISYTKRLFYVIMLIMMAPIVVVFDFFVKFGS